MYFFFNLTFWPQHLAGKHQNILKHILFKLAILSLNNIEKSYYHLLPTLLIYHKHIKSKI